MNCFVYIIYSKKIDKYYIGCSNNPKRRLKYHNLGKGGGRAYTKRAKYWRLVYTKLFYERKSALEYERKLKRMKSRKYIESIIKS